ncbi:hypothetical protein V5F40_21735 [Xanthobacter sp. DSM 14520]|uniref:hypothetical protein n=1 Tax=Xanthobacter autotrophicus (strain ATCC BAA-1158 / Py2) TaxID=78245 RepID=UPI00372B480C
MMKTQQVEDGRMPRCASCWSSDIVLVEHGRLVIPGLPSELHDRVEASFTDYGCSCGARSHQLTLACVSVPDPCGIGHCSPDDLVQQPDATEHFLAAAESGEEWSITRRHYRTGRMPFGGAALLPRGPFVADLHRFGPLKGTMNRLGTSAGAIKLMERLAPAAGRFLHAQSSSR